jgi:hypothetical protein
MYGTPMHLGSVTGILSPVFTNIVLFWSPGDWIQPIDVISTEGHQRARNRMAEVVPDLDDFVRKNPTLHRYDVHVCVGGCTHHITHVNMWLMGRSKPIVRGFLDELPLVVLTPLFMQTLEKNGCAQTQYRLTVQVDAQACWTCLARDEQPVRSRRWFRHRCSSVSPLGECHACEAELYRVLREWDQRAHELWRTQDHWRSVVFNHKNFEIVKSILWS